MTTTIFLNGKADNLGPYEAIPSVQLASDGYYWFLYRYFECANLERHADDLIDLYGGRVIEGYQLYRLRFELLQALEDIQHKSDQWVVLTGWNGERAEIDKEIWQSVEKFRMTELVRALLKLVDGVSDSLQLVSSGD